MTQGTDYSEHRPAPLVLAADGFLLAAAVDLVLISVVFGATSLLLEGDLPDWMQGGSGLLMLVVLLGGPLLVWTLHGLKLRWRAVLGMIAGVVLGGGAAVGLFIGAGMLPRLWGVSADEPPWFGVGVLVLLGGVFTAISVYAGVTDLRQRPPDDRRLDLLRLGAFVVLLVLMGLFVWLGAAQHNEAGEAAIFAAIFGLASAFAVFGAALIDRPPAEE